MNIAIIGARGCIGSALIQKLVITTEHQIIASYRREEEVDESYKRVIWKRINLYDDLGTEEFLIVPTEGHTAQGGQEGVDVVIYLVHSLADKNFEAMDKEFANRVGKFSKKTGVQKIIYLGGIIPAKGHLSAHLRSRKQTGEALGAYGVPVAEIRASVVLGNCSASYQMVYWLAKRLPILIMPRWSVAKCSPIALDDVVDMIIALIERNVSGHELFEIGSGVMGYNELIMKSGMIERGRESHIIYTQSFPIMLAARIVQLITRVPWRLAAALMESLKNESAVTNNRFAEVVGRSPKSIDAVLQKAAQDMKASN